MGDGGLSQMARVGDAFVAPTKTFEDIRRDASWWMPFLLSALLGLVFAYTVLNKIGLPTLVDGVVHQSSALEDRMANGTPEEIASTRHAMEMQFKAMYVAPAIFLVVAFIVAGIFLGTANFVFGGRATYGQMLAVWFYGTLPLTLVSILTIITVFAGASGDSFNIRNTVGDECGVLPNEWGHSALAGDFAEFGGCDRDLGGAAVDAGDLDGGGDHAERGSDGGVRVVGIYVLMQTAVAAFTG